MSFLMCPLPTDYPWRWSQAIPMNSALIKWLYLPDFFRAPNSTNLISKCNPTTHPRIPAHPTGECKDSIGGVLVGDAGTFAWNQQGTRCLGVDS